MTPDFKILEGLGRLEQIFGMLFVLKWLNIIPVDEISDLGF